MWLVTLQVDSECYIKLSAVRKTCILSGGKLTCRTQSQTTGDQIRPRNTLGMSLCRSEYAGALSTLPQH